MSAVKPDAAWPDDVVGHHAAELARDADTKRRDRLIENLLVAQAMVLDLPLTAFTPYLGEFANTRMLQGGPHACGAAACFGGWVAQHPHFQKQGVRAGFGGAPYHASGRNVSILLFGTGGMFAGGVYSGFASDEKQEVLRRIENALASTLEGDYVGV